MIEELGVVKETLNKNLAIVVADRSSMCGNCPSKNLCHPFGNDKNQMEIKVFNNINASKGDKVKIVIKEKNFLKASFIVYGLPILFLIIFSLIGKKIFNKDIFSFITGITGMIISFFIVKKYDSRKKETFLPEITEIIK